MNFYALIYWTTLKKYTEAKQWGFSIAKMIYQYSEIKYETPASLIVN